MNVKAEILIVEDDLVVRSNLEILLSELGYRITGFANNAMDALVLFSSRNPDLVIADIGLTGEVDGIELVKRMTEIKRVPIVFLTAHASEDVFERAKSALPFAYITKPIDRVNLERTIDLALEHYAAQDGTLAPADWTNPTSDCLYTRIGNKLKKIMVNEITHIDVDGKYCGLNRANNHTRVNIKMSLKEIMDRLPRNKFVQVNRNCIVNMDYVEDVEMNHLHITICGNEIPISRVYKENLFARMNIV
ncbi:MAG: response regulator [Flavobacteriales bacterium]|nr:response regulator [Flavobacteriales bacterium]